MTDDAAVRRERDGRFQREALGCLRDGPLEDAWLSGDLAPAIERALAGLPEVLRTAVVLVDLQNLKYQDAARVLEVPAGTVRSRLFRGRRVLQEALLAYAQDAGYAPSHPQYEFERSFLTALERARHSHSDPARLRNRVAAALRAEGMGGI